MDRLPPLKPTPSQPGASSHRSSGHGTAMAGSRSGPMHPHGLVVSVHDVSPSTRTACDAILNDLETLGVKHCSLLVVPDHHRQGHFLADADFCSWLCHRAEAGHEIVVHGYYHQRERQPEESLPTQLTTRFYTADEGEFYDIDQPHAAALYEQAREDFRQIGLVPDGFIAPAWLLSSAGEAALKEAGCEYTTRLQSITDLRTGRQQRSQSLCWSVRSAWRRLTSLGWNALLFHSLRSNPLLRIAIHPVDVAHSRIWMQIRRLVGRALEDRAPYTYERWVTRERAFGLKSR